MPDWSTLGTIILGGGGLVTGILALFSARANKGKINSETKLNIANVEHTREQLHQSRELFLRNEIENIRQTFDHEIEELRDQVSSLQSLIEIHVPWDWEVVRQFKLLGIDFREPPTLNYIKHKSNKDRGKHDNPGIN